MQDSEMIPGEWISVIYDDGKRVTCRFLSITDGCLVYGGPGWSDAVDLSVITIERLSHKYNQPVGKSG